MSKFRLSARRAVVFALLLLASIHIDAAAARAMAPDAPVPAVDDPAAMAEGAATLDAALHADGSLMATPCPRTGGCIGYIVPLAPPLAVPAPIREGHPQEVWQTPAPIAVGQLTPPPR